MSLLLLTQEKWIKEAKEKEKSGADLINFFYISDKVLRLSLLLAGAAGTWRRLTLMSV